MVLKVTDDKTVCHPLSLPPLGSGNSRISNNVFQRHTTQQVVSFKTTDASDLKKIDDLSARFLLMYVHTHTHLHPTWRYRDTHTHRCVEKDYDEEELKEAHKEVSAAQHAERTKKQQSQQGKRPGAGGQSKAKRKR